jgi:hypothetical protein
MPLRHVSAIDPEFLGKLETWLGGLPEILVLIRYPYAAGNKDFEFFSSFDALSSRIRNLPARTSLIAFRRPQLEVRGVVDEKFIAACLNHIPDGSEFLVVETERRAHGKHSWFHWLAGETHAELRDALAESVGVPVAVGPYPPFPEDSDDVISAIMPDQDGLVRIGTY